MGAFFLKHCNLDCVASSLSGCAPLNSAVVGALVHHAATRMWEYMQHPDFGETLQPGMKGFTHNRKQEAMTRTYLYNLINRNFICEWEPMMLSREPALVALFAGPKYYKNKASEVKGKVSSLIFLDKIAGVQFCRCWGDPPSMGCESYGEPAGETSLLM